MPLYTTLCLRCRTPGQVFRKVDERDENLPECCGATVIRTITAPAVHADIPAYESPKTGKWITSRSERREDLARSNCYEWEPGIEKDIERNKVAREAREAAQVDAYVDAVVRDLHTSGRLDNAAA